MYFNNRNKHILSSILNKYERGFCRSYAIASAELFQEPKVLHFLDLFCVWEHANKLLGEGLFYFIQHSVDIPNSEQLK